LPFRWQHRNQGTLPVFQMISCNHSNYHLLISRIARPRRSLRPQGFGLPAWTPWICRVGARTTSTPGVSPFHD